MLTQIHRPYFMRCFACPFQKIDNILNPVGSTVVSYPNRWSLLFTYGFLYGYFRPNMLKFPFLTKPVLLWLLDPGGPDADHPDEQNQQDDEDNSASDSWGGFKMETILAWSLSHLQQCRQTLILIRNPLPWNFQHIGSRRLHICPSRKRPEEGKVKKKNLYKIKVTSFWHRPSQVSVQSPVSPLP